MKPKQTIDMRRVVIHPDSLMIELEEASQIIKVTQYKIDTDKPFKVLCVGSRVHEFMPIEVGDEVFIEDISATKVMQLTFNDSDKVIKCINVFSTNVAMLLKAEQTTGTTVFEGIASIHKMEGDKPQPDSNVVSHALDSQRDGIC